MQENEIAQLLHEANTQRAIKQRELQESSERLVESRTLVSHLTKLQNDKRQAVISQEAHRSDRQQDLVQRKNAIANAKSKLAALTDEQSQIQRERDEAKGELGRLEIALNEKQSLFDDLQSRVLDTDQAKRQLVIRIDSVARAHDRQEVVVNTNVSELCAFIAQIEHAHEQLPALASQLEKAEASLSMVEADVNVKIAALQESQQNLAAIRKVRGDLLKERDRLSDSLTERRSLKTRFAVELEQLESELAALNLPSSDEGDESEPIDVSAIQQEIEAQSVRLERLGLINYRATTDLEDRITEKEELDQHVADLEDALHKVESAIDRIDTETKKSLRDTFEAVNEQLARLFAALFGGGTASLEFTDEDILRAGVIVRARPPGKRNATINMLSGGERAMTAIAFVFALFQLNPSPVCILDEVDAPLDERNVVKFVELLASMSADTQFVVITHNPATMELAGNLLGVTMEEAGVSRLVAVNLEDAYVLAAQQ